VSVLGLPVSNGLARLEAEDPELDVILAAERMRQSTTLSLVASSTVVDPSVLVAMASPAVNVTAEGYPGRRYHAGCSEVDRIEQLAIDRAKSLFKASYANVQPHSASTANYAVLSALLEPNDTLLGMALDAGGHLTHGASAAYAGRYFNALGYGICPDGTVDFDQVAELANKHRPKVMICGATAYSQFVDFARFREIADQVGAILVADISHIAGLVAVGLHPSPIEHAHITTLCTHKQLGGPRGALILSGSDHGRVLPHVGVTVDRLTQRAVFPYFQGAPAMNSIAAKARALAIAASPEFTQAMRRIVLDAAAIAEKLKSRGYTIVSGGTRNHTVLVDLSPLGITGKAAESELEKCRIIVNKNKVPGDQRSPHIASGIRIGTNSIAHRGMGPDEASETAELVHEVLSSCRSAGDAGKSVDEDKQNAISGRVREICKAFPIPGYEDAPVSAVETGVV
jgi:glycine hydroxymethyltransferase